MITAESQKSQWPRVDWQGQWSSSWWHCCSEQSEGTYIYSVHAHAHATCNMHMHMHMHMHIHIHMQ